jgi:hypothetical protein
MPQVRNWTEGLVASLFLVFHFVYLGGVYVIVATRIMMLIYCLLCLPPLFSDGPKDSRAYDTS